MPFSDTTNKTGIIQIIEFWTNLGDAAISGNTTLLKQFTARVNEGFDRLMPFLLSYSDYLRFDDVNNSGQPFGTINLVSGQADYTVSQDNNSLDILNVTDVRILASATGTTYFDLEKMSIDDPRAIEAMAPASTSVGVPIAWLERGNTIFLYPQPNYSATAGIKLFYERQQSIFVSSDTTKEAGIPRPFIRLLPMYAAYDWLCVNKQQNIVLITRLEAQIARAEKDLRDMIAKKYPTHARISNAGISFR
jgi:hypothetical protein